MKKTNVLFLIFISTALIGLVIPPVGAIAFLIGLYFIYDVFDWLHIIYKNQKIIIEKLDALASKEDCDTHSISKQQEV